MIRIIVNNQELTIYHDTSFVMELNNPVFSIDAIEGDVVYNFDIPVAGNEKVFGFAHSPYTIEHKLYDCLVYVDGVQLIQGNLVIQKTTRLSYSVAIVVSPFPEGWADSSVRNNDDEEIIIAHSYETHRADWVEFLQSSLAEDSNVKFGIFQNEEGYGEANEGFQNHPGYSAMQKLVNRLFAYNGVVVNISENNPSSLFGVLFNKYSVHWTRGHSGLLAIEMTARNVFCFCPQLRLPVILKKVFAACGFNTSGAFFSRLETRNVFIQSPKAIDGTIHQYASEENELAWYRGQYTDDDYSDTPIVLQPGDYSFEGMYCDPEYRTVLDEEGWARTPYDYHANMSNHITVNFPHLGQYIIDWNGSYRFTVNLKIPPCDCILQLRIMIFTGSNVDYEDDPRGDIIYLSEPIDMPTDGTEVSKSFVLQLSSAQGTMYSVKVCREWPGRNARIETRDEDNGTTNVTYESRTWYIPVNVQSTLYIQQLSFDNGKELNIYAKSFVPMHFLPDISNADFVKSIRNSFGLTFFVDYSTHEIEFGFIFDLPQSKSMDISDGLLNRETTKDLEDSSGYVFNFGSLEEEEENAIEDIAGEVDSFSNLPDPFDNIGKMILVKDENYYYKPVLKSQEDGSMTAIWGRGKNASIPLMIGAGETEIQPIASVPGSVALQYGRQRVVPDIPFEIESDMFGTEISNELILLVYRGKSSFSHRRRTYQIEDMRPFCRNLLCLTSTGDNSVGEIFVKPWLQLLDKESFITYKFLLPIGKILELMRLIRPQHATPEHQVRFVMVNNIRILPKKISIQVDNSGDRYLCEIQGIRA